VERIYEAAKKSERILTEEELLALAGPVSAKSTRHSH
jgi:hypothetical protein